MKKPYVHSLTALAIGLCFATPSHAIEISKSSADLGSLEQPAAMLPGTTMTYIRNGEEITATLEKVEEDSIHWNNSDGCKYSTPKSEPLFVPSISWENCRGSTGTQTLGKMKKSFWPLSAKTKVKFGVSGRSKGNTWKDYKRCKVNGTHTVTVAGGTFDAYMVECAGKWDKRYWYYSPELGHNVAGGRKHKTDGTRNFEWEHKSSKVVN